VINDAKVSITMTLPLPQSLVFSQFVKVISGNNTIMFIVTIPSCTVGQPPRTLPIMDGARPPIPGAGAKPYQ
jgi:hypothetical protein